MELFIILEHLSSPNASSGTAHPPEGTQVHRLLLVELLILLENSSLPTASSGTTCFIFWSTYVYRLFLVGFVFFYLIFFFHFIRSSYCIFLLRLTFCDYTHPFGIFSYFVLIENLRAMERWAYLIPLRRVWRYQRGNQNPYIEEQTTQWRKETLLLKKTVLYLSDLN